MKRIALLLTLLTLAFGSTARANAIPLGFGTIRSEIVSQLTTASNNIAGNVDVVANKKLLAPLKKALALIDKPSTHTLVDDTKVLSLLAALNKTSLSNTFGPLLNNSLNSYLSVLYSSAGSSSNNLAGTYPSGIHTAAGKKLVTLYAQLLNADSFPDLIAAAKQLAAAAKTLGVVDALVIKAENVPAPKATITATTSGAANLNIKTFAAVIAETGPGNFIINGGTKPTPNGAIQIALVVLGVTDGTHTVSVSDGDIAVLSFHGGSAAYVSGTGTATVTYNSSTKAMFGTFSWSGYDQDNHARIINVNGSFTGTKTP